MYRGYGYVDKDMEVTPLTPKISDKAFLVRDKALFPNLSLYSYLPKEQRNEKPLAEDVEMRLTKSFHRKAYNITTDSFFTTAKVAGLLQEKGTTLVGTVRANVKRISKEITKQGNEKFLASFSSMMIKSACS